MLYQKRNAMVDAIRWWKPGDHPLVVRRDDGWAIATPEGWRAVASGDRIVTDLSGCAWPVCDPMFHCLYEPADQSSRTPLPE